MQIVAIQPRLDGFAGKLRRKGLEDPENARDGYQLGMKFLTEDARAYVLTRAGHSTPAQRAVDMHTPVRDHLGPGAHG